MKRLLPLLLIICCGSIMAQTDFRSSRVNTTPYLKKSEMIGYTPHALWLLKQNQKQQITFSERIKNNNLPADKTEIILEAHDIWGYGTIGYQMLLDEDHDTYGELYDASTVDYFYNDYNSFEYKIPVDAEADMNTKTVVINGEGRVEIPAGTYDYLITSPLPHDGIMIPSGTFSRFNDFKFEGGYTYRFKVTLTQNEYGNIDIVNIFTDIDAAVTELVLPANGIDLTASEPITITITNNGIAAISGFPVSYEINGSKAITETYTGNIQSGKSASYTFNTKADFSAEQNYKVKAYTSLPNDLVPYNDSVEKNCRHIGVATLPFICNFTSAEDFESEWTVISANSGNNSWQFGDGWEGPDGQMGAVSCPTWAGNCNDYLITPPIHLDKGNNYITFYTKGITADSEEMLDVRYGKDTNAEEMEIIGDYTFKNSEFRMNVINFEIAESGTYYFAFHAKSVAGTNLILDDITIDAGVFDVSAKLLIEKVLLPYSNCDLSDQSIIGARLRNEGTGAASTFTLSYTVNDGTTVTQTFTDPIPVGESKNYYFDTPANLIDLGEYSIEVTVNCDGESESKTASITHYAPLTELPFVTNFYMNTGINGYWTQMTEKTWQYDSFGTRFSSNKPGVENGLLSRCFTLNNSFRIKIAYFGGYFTSPASFYIAYGKPGTDPANWEKIYEDKNILGDVEKEFSTELKTPGEYSFVIVNSTEEDRISMGLYQFTLSEIQDYDLRIVEVNSPLSNYMPINHLKNVGNYTVNIENRGSKPMTGIKAYVSNDNEVMFSSTESISLESAAIKPLQISGSLEQLITSSHINLKVEVKGEQADMYPADNMQLLPSIHLTDTVFATERLTSFTNGTGVSGSTCNFGNIYTLTETDTLTSVSVGLGLDDYYSTPVNMGVAVYSLKADGVTLDRELYSTIAERGAGGALKEFSFTPRILPAGKYYFEVQQLEVNNIGLSYEIADNSFFYQNTDGILQLISGYGNIAVRANFNHRSKAYQKNATATEITTPTHSKALFSSEEIITAIVENRGAQAITDMEVRCDINGTVKKTLKIDLAPYEKQSVEFAPIDLSTPGEYIIKVYTLLEGDENKEDDSVTLAVVSAEEANPYILDFESCNDFDTDHEFNPRWWTIDRLGYEVDSWWQFNYPHSGQPVGFLAYNIMATTPPMTDGQDLGFFPHSGERFGAAFSTSNQGIDSDTWLISPKLSLSGNSVLELYVKTFALQSPYAELERYNLLISDTDDNFESFKKLGEERRAPTDWTKVTADLSSYNNKEVYIAIQYVSQSLQGIVMMVDDINVKTDGVSIQNTSTNDGVQLWVNREEKMITISSVEEITGVTLYMSSGRKIYQSARLETNNYRLPIGMYEPGVYVAHIRTANGTEMKKFILAK